MRVFFYLLIITASALIIFSGCTKNENPIIVIIDENNNGFETKEVAEIFAINCATSGCHVGSTPASGLSLENYELTMKGSSNRSGGTVENYGGDVVIPFRLDESLLFQVITDNVTPISPHDVVSLRDDQKNSIQQWIENGARDNNGNLPFQAPSFRIYVCNQGSDKVSVIDGSSKVVSGIIDLDMLQTMESPHMVKEKGDFIYVTLIAAQKFLKIRKSDYTIVGEVNGITKAGMIQISPDGTKAYVSRSSTSDPIFNTIFVIDLAAMTTIKEILLPAPGVPHGLALTPDGTKLYVANLTLDRVSIIDAVNDEFVDDIPLTPGTEPMQTAISPDGNYLYISSRGLGQLQVYDTSADTLITSVQMNMMPMHIAISSTGNKIYVGSMGAHVVMIVEKNGNTWTKTKEISHPGFNMLHGADLTADDKYLFVSSRNTNGNFATHFTVGGEGHSGTLGIIDTETEKVVKLIEIEEHGAGLVVEK